jgi:hypothetical protein
VLVLLLLVVLLLVLLLLVIGDDTVPTESAALLDITGHLDIANYPGNLYAM